MDCHVGLCPPRNDRKGMAAAATTPLLPSLRDQCGTLVVAIRTLVLNSEFQ